VTGGLQRALRRYLLDPDARQARLRAVGLLRALWLLRRCERGERVSVHSSVRVVAQGRIRIGARVQFFEGMIPQELVAAPGAELSIGEATLLNYGASIRAAQSIRIGARCLFGSFSIVRDEAQGRTASVVIGDDVWIAHGAIVEPGVTIGDGSVVGAGSVVTSDVPPRMLAVGNPATLRPLPARES
jgi:maltose O-acetyltransferase